MSGRLPSTGADTAEHRGISDLVAYVLMFSVIITSIALLSSGAFDPLIEFTDHEQIENSERGMKVAASTLDEMHRQGDTRREFRIVLGGGGVFMNQSAINVSSPTNPSINRTYQVNSLEHRFERSPRDVTIAYEAGGVFRDPSGVTRYSPSVTCGDEVAIVSLVRLDPNNNFALSEDYDRATLLNPWSIPEEETAADLGQSLAFTARTGTVRRNATRFGAGGTVRINVSQSANQAQWRQYLRRESDWTVTDEVGAWECTGVDRTLVRVTSIRLDLFTAVTQSP